jgi:hypothetical protein
MLGRVNRTMHHLVAFGGGVTGLLIKDKSQKITTARKWFKPLKPEPEYFVRAVSDKAQWSTKDVPPKIPEVGFADVET